MSWEGKLGHGHAHNHDHGWGYREDVTCAAGIAATVAVSRVVAAGRQGFVVVRGELCQGVGHRGCDDDDDVEEEDDALPYVCMYLRMYVCMCVRMYVFVYV
jgi:hypothetical protein